MTNPAPRAAFRLCLAGLVAAGVVACGGSGEAPASGGSVARPSSPALVTIVAPGDGATLSGPTVHVVVRVAHARVVQATTTQVAAR